MRIKRTGDVVIELNAKEASKIVKQMDDCDFIKSDAPELWELWDELR